MLNINGQNSLILNSHIFYTICNIKIKVNNLYIIKFTDYKVLIKSTSFFNSKTESY